MPCGKLIRLELLAKRGPSYLDQLKKLSDEDHVMASNHIVQLNRVNMRGNPNDHDDMVTLWSLSHSQRRLKAIETPTCFLKVRSMPPWDTG